MNLLVRLPCLEHCRPQGFPSLAIANGQTTHPGGQIMPRTETDSLTMRPGGQNTPGIEVGSLITSPGGQTTHETKAGGLTATPGGQIARPCAAPSSPGSSTLVAPYMAPTTSVMPHAMPTTPPVPHVALPSTTTATPPSAPGSQLYP
jgi:hypothetical protein